MVSGYDVGGLHLGGPNGGFRSPLPPARFMKWGEPISRGHACSWHPLAGKNGNPTPGFTATPYPPRPICFVPFPGNPNDNNHTPGVLPLSWVNMCEFMCNNLSECLGEEYKGFDTASVSRSPAFDLALTTRVLSVEGMVQTKGNNKFYGVDCDPSTGTMIAEFDCPADAWFFKAAPRDDVMPYSILMEIALQTCGILTSWNKAPLTLARLKGPDGKEQGYNLLFRNLDATATLIKKVDMRNKTIKNISKCTGYSMLGQMGVQKFSTTLEIDGEAFYQVDSSFGWFLPAVFEKQVGLDAGKTRDCWHVTAAHPVKSYAMPADEARIFAEAAVGPHALARRSEQVRFIDEISFSKGGGMHGKGYAHAYKTVDKRDWFFSCHFWCDAVMPGSLGVESMHQMFELWCVHAGHAAGIPNPTFDHDLGKTAWKYRGQFTPKNDRCDFEVHVSSVEKVAGAATITADGYINVDKLRV